MAVIHYGAMKKTDCNWLGQMARDRGSLEKYCTGPGAQNDSFTKKVAEEILRRVRREWYSDLKISSDRESYRSWRGDSKYLHILI